MPLTELPEKTDDSLGREKVDRPAEFPRTPDLRYDVTAAEFERIKDAIVAMADELGVSVATTDATETTLFSDTDGGNRVIRALVSAVETDGTRVDYRHWFLVGQKFVTHENNVIVVSNEISSDGSGGSSGWIAEFKAVAGVLTLRVTGQAATPIQWRALVKLVSS